MRDITCLPEWQMKTDEPVAIVLNDGDATPLLEHLGFVASDLLVHIQQGSVEALAVLR